MAKINYSIVQAIAAAVLFGASTPLLKLLLINIEPIYAAAYLYLGSSIIYLYYRIMRSVNSNVPAYDDRLRGSDLLWLAGAILTGGSAPSMETALRVMLVGLFCYGGSISFYILSMRNLGAARASAYFASAPFAGALISFILFKQFPNERA